MKETRTGNISLSSDGIILVRIKTGVTQVVEDAEENLRAAVALARPSRRPILVDIRYCQPLEPEVRHYYGGKVLVEAFTSLALLVDASPLGQMIGNLYFHIAKPGIPTQLFVEEHKALAWLKGLTA